MVNWRSLVYGLVALAAVGLGVDAIWVLNASHFAGVLSGGMEHTTALQIIWSLVWFLAAFLPAVACVLFLFNLRRGGAGRWMSGIAVVSVAFAAGYAVIQIIFWLIRGA